MLLAMIRSLVTAVLLTVAALLALSGEANAVHFNPDACLDLSHVEDVRSGTLYRFVEVPGPTSDGCPLWKAVPVE
jgi:hypothetical protein